MTWLNCINSSILTRSFTYAASGDILTDSRSGALGMSFEYDVEGRLSKAYQVRREIKMESKISLPTLKAITSDLIDAYIEASGEDFLQIENGDFLYWSINPRDIAVSNEKKTRIIHWEPS